MTEYGSIDLTENYYEIAIACRNAVALTEVQVLS